MDISKQPPTACSICGGERVVRNAADVSFEYSNVWWAVVCLSCGHITLHLMERQRLWLVEKVQKERKKKTN